MKRLSAKDVKNVYDRCLSLVRRKPAEFVVFKKLKICGWCLYEDDTVIIDHRKDMLRTAYHECIHYLFPEWSETQVIYAESRVVNGVTILENIRFLKHLTAKAYKSALQRDLQLRRARKKKKYKYEARNNKRDR